MYNAPLWCWLTYGTPIFSFFQQEGLRSDQCRQEVCGGIVEHEQGPNFEAVMGVPRPNIDIFPEKFFSLDISGLLESVHKPHVVRGIYHSHVCHPPMLSYLDMQVMLKTGLDMVIIAIPHNAIRRFRKIGDTYRCLEIFTWSPLEEITSQAIEQKKRIDFSYAHQWFDLEAGVYRVRDGLINTPNVNQVNR